MLCPTHLFVGHCHCVRCRLLLGNNQVGHLQPPLVCITAEDPTRLDTVGGSAAVGVGDAEETGKGYCDGTEKVGRKDRRTEG